MLLRLIEGRLDGAIPTVLFAGRAEANIHGDGGIESVILALQSQTIPTAIRFLVVQGNGRREKRRKKACWAKRFFYYGYFSSHEVEMFLVILRVL